MFLALVRRHPGRAAGEGDDVAELQLPAATLFDVAVHPHQTLRDDGFRFRPGVDQVREPQELTEADAA